MDTLLKQEFDIHRAQGSKHPLLERYGVDARPVPHEQLAQWRENFQGVQFLHKPTNFLIFGAIDDLWQEPDGNHIVVDYKATAKRDAVTELTTRWHEGYKRQMEVYQWLLRRNDLSVSDTGYFVYCNGRADREAFDGKLEFDVTLIAHTGNDEWVEPIIHDIHTCLNSDTVPAFGEECEHCAFVEDALHLST